MALTSVPLENMVPAVENKHVALVHVQPISGDLICNIHFTEKAKKNRPHLLHAHLLARAFHPQKRGHEILLFQIVQSARFRPLAPQLKFIWGDLGV